MSYEKIKAILNHANASESLTDLIKKLGEDPAFIYKKSKEALIRRQRKQYINKCQKLGFLNEQYQLTELGKAALRNFNEVLANQILELNLNGHTFKDLLFSALADVDIPTTERIHQKMKELGVSLPIQQLRNYLNILAKCGILKKNRKYTYTLPELTVADFEAILRQEYQKSEKDPSGLIWFEKYKENIRKKYNLTESRFDELFSKLKRNKPRLISLQRSRTKTWIRLREI
ncbi:MAG: hypothetical protein ACTSRS_06835 [Candidatus Helarchaeota archaeon]